MPQTYWLTAEPLRADTSLVAPWSRVRVAVLFWSLVSPTVLSTASGFAYHPDQDGYGDDGDDHQDE